MNTTVSILSFLLPWELWLNTNPVVFAFVWPTWAPPSVYLSISSFPLDFYSTFQTHFTCLSKLEPPPALWRSYPITKATKAPYQSQGPTEFSSLALQWTQPCLAWWIKYQSHFSQAQFPRCQFYLILFLLTTWFFPGVPSFWVPEGAI